MGVRIIKFVCMHACVLQGIEFVDNIHLFIFKRSVKDDLLDSEIHCWLMLLLQLVEVTGYNPAVQFALFIYGKEPVLTKYKRVSEKFVSHTK